MNFPPQVPGAAPAAAPSFFLQVTTLDPTNGNNLWELKKAIEEGAQTAEVANYLDANPEVLNDNRRGDPLLVFVSSSGRMDLVSLLLDPGADVNRRGSSLYGDVYKTALLAAAEAGHLDVIELLLARGARITDVGDDEIDVERGADPLAARSAPAGGNGPGGLPMFTIEDLASMFLTSKQLEHSWNALMHAARRNDAPMAAALLTRGAAADVRQRSSSGTTAADLTTDSLIKDMLDFAAGSAASLPAEATELLVAQAPGERRREAAALLWSAGQLGAELDRAVKDRLLMCMAREWMRSAGEAASEAAAASAVNPAGSS